MSMSYDKNTKYKNLFLAQSYADSLDEYNVSLSRENSPPAWDCIVLTASNESQALSYRQQIEHRLKKGRLHSGTQYIVLPDIMGKRIGSGGAMLNVLSYLANLRSSSDFTGLRILCIHSGGDSKRIPQYSVCGKLFSPIPRVLPDGTNSTLFDELIIGMNGVAHRMTDGMLTCSGDVLLLFNPLQIDFHTKGAAALSIKAPGDKGGNHGVFIGDIDGNASGFLHKKPINILTEFGALDTSGNVNIDTGAVIFDSNILNSLYSLIDSDEKFHYMVNNSVRLSFYTDFVYPLAADSTLADFLKETPEGDFTPELLHTRELIWDRLRRYSMKLICLSPASFIHFGTTHELLHLVTEEISDFRFLDWSMHINTNIKDDRYSARNSYISRNAKVGNGSYIEDSYIQNETVIGKNCVISGVTLSNVYIPDNTVLHGLKLNDGKFTVRMYGVNDNPKETKLFGRDIGEPLWTAPIYPVCCSMAEAVEKTLNKEKSDMMISLMDSFNEADVTALLPWQEKLSDKIIAESMLDAIDNDLPVKEAEILFCDKIPLRVKNHLIEVANMLDDNDITQFSRKIRIYYYLSKFIYRDEMLDSCFETIRNSVWNTVSKYVKYNTDVKIAKDEVVTELPVRVNWGGGWSDTPPYCMEHGGTVLNSAITLDGRLPIEVTLRKEDTKKIILASSDIGSYREFTDIKELQTCSDPNDVFALHKAALIACGIIPYKEYISFDEVIDKLGSGFYMNTRVINIPKGSGLGTSSILAGACVKGIYEFLGVKISENELYNIVLCMEQLMSTGGGWQDQVGGITKGIKMITTEKGLKQEILCTPISLSEESLGELRKRFVIIYTGQRRLARNLLREVIGRYIGNNANSLEVLYEIQRVAVLMKFELEKGNIDGFAKLLSYHWELSKRLDGGCTNTCIEQIFISIDDLIDGKMICGAGGGGFLQVILKKTISVDALRERLWEVFGDSGVSIWNCEFFM